METCGVRNSIVFSINHHGKPEHSFLSITVVLCHVSARYCDVEICLLPCMVFTITDHRATVVLLAPVFADPRSTNNVLFHRVTICVAMCTVGHETINIALFVREIKTHISSIFILFPGARKGR